MSHQGPPSGAPQYRFPRSDGLPSRSEPNSARPRGFKPAVKSASSDYAAWDGDGRHATRPADASSYVSTDSDARDDNPNIKPLPEPTADLSVAAGALVTERLGCQGAEPSQVKEAIQRVVCGFRKS